MNIGDRFSLLTVAALISHSKNPKALCYCKCGGVCVRQRGGLRNGRSTHCGCRKIARLSELNSRHGMTGTAIYSTWCNMLDRCRNPKNHQFNDYGGRGISVCNRWMTFENFYADMGDRPPGLLLERINNDLGYKPSNCKWATWNDQAKNKRVSKRWLVNGIWFDSSTEASAFFNVHPSVIIRGCNGYTRNGREYPPRQGWSASLKYMKTDKTQALKP